MKSYQIAVILTIPANSYQEAKDKAQELENSLGTVDPKLDELADSVEYRVVIDYEHDNDGQRVLYLPSEEQPDDAG